MARVIHFEIHAESPERAIDFYSAVFGWRFTRWTGPEEYWLVTTGPRDEPGIDGGLVRRRGAVEGEAVIGYVCTISVNDLDRTLGDARRLGGILAVAPTEIPGVGRLAYMKDTEGNIFGMIEAASSDGP
ncbi:MAG TPA: VOC family protein [Gemmatimonadales bacterium]|nr:VOC family protein [Gemmatimonadales bacterium]